MTIFLNKLQPGNISALIHPFFAKNRNIQLLLLVMCAFAVNINTLSNNFVYDDVPQIVNNSWITNVKYIPDIFTHDATHADQMGASNYYRPLMNLIYMIEYYAFSGLKPWGFHLVNVIFHIGVTVLVFIAASLLMRDVGSTFFSPFLSAPFVSALIFTLHPIHAEVVAWVACVPELTFTFFCLLSLCFHIKSLHAFDRGHFISLAFFGIAIFCKETTVALVPILALYDSMYRADKSNLRHYVTRYAPFVLVVGIYALLRSIALGGMAPVSRHPELDTFEVILNIIPLFGQYLEKLILPINLNAFYVLHPAHSITEPTWLFSLLVVTAFSVLSYVLFHKNKSAFLGLIIITIPLLPVLYIPWSGITTFADRYLYFPSIGFAITTVSLLADMKISKDRWRTPLSMLLASILIAYSIGTIRRNRIWHDELSLWTDTVRKSPDGSHVHFSLGLALAGKGDRDAAVNEFREALRITPDFAQAHNSLGLVFAKEGNMDEAIREFQKALAIKPDDTKTHVNMGLALGEKGDQDAAIKEFYTALSIDPQSIEAHNNLGRAFIRKGALDAAIKEFQAALAINANYNDAHHNLGLALANKGDLDAAIREFREALAINPDDFASRNILEIALKQKNLQGETRK
ncbi:MAG: tetratricopeptide repeat protein [Oryzomonas sp.]|uniref:tetratricopeptide repeat protein n=1 Tax=Oryzomonas sp. TaxID=2855186 RepID=UPI00284CF640|nr:tetratricopeptide repeat protein [Oryzomonas sp.]MDR3580391.1 tetratricopeptide repeat protein [Oryzomonas sp.]